MKTTSREDRKKQAKRAALRALKKARRRAAAKLSPWEDEFLVSVEARVEKYGRAFGDPEKGGMDSSLSIRQAVKVKEIAAKAKPKGLTRRSGLRRKP